MEDMFQHHGYATCINASESNVDSNDIVNADQTAFECDCDSFALKCIRTKPTCSRST